MCGARTPAGLWQLSVMRRIAATGFAARGSHEGTAPNQDKDQGLAVAYQNAIWAEGIFQNVL